MITENQLRIFRVFAGKPFGEFTRKQIKAAAKEKSNNALALAIRKFSGEGLIREKKVGNSSLLSLNLDNDKVYQYMAIANTEKLGVPVQRSIGIIREEIDKITHFYSLVIFGSYATNEQKGGSDLDIAVFVETDEKRNDIEAAVNSAAQKTPVGVDFHMIAKAEFIEMLANEEENLGKQIARKHLAVHNHRIFYELVKEGMKRGFDV
jgi:predicted nucleotidyltransferase